MKTSSTLFCTFVFIGLAGCKTPADGLRIEADRDVSSQYQADVPYWIPIIDQCMADGGQRTECIESLPQEVLADFEDWERSQNRRALMNSRNGGFGVRQADNNQ